MDRLASRLATISVGEVSAFRRRREVEFRFREGLATSLDVEIQFLDPGVEVYAFTFG